MQYLADLFKEKGTISILFTAAEAIMPPFHQLLLNATWDCKRSDGCTRAKVQGVVLRVQDSFLKERVFYTANKN